ncbi:FAD binding domain-containing protein [Cellulophaga baltica]|nr:FAD binding domain-containing protein [Cellulophaga baltica]
MTLLDFIRYEKRLTGTKIGCREGDCAACTALVGTMNANGVLEYQSITSCISPLGNAHGKHIVTIEGINLKNELNVAQEAMKLNYATQCGFCTPGFVLSLTGFTFSGKENTNENIMAAISGNICRCTGYKSIQRAATDIATKLEALELDNKMAWLVANSFIPEYFLTIPDKIKKIPVKQESEANSFVVSGGTDMYVQRADSLIDEQINLVSDHIGLKGIIASDDKIVIGANTTVTEFASHTIIQELFPNLKKHMALVSSEPIRNMASFGGNFVNASPIGDMTIFFLALNTSITLQNEKGTREILLKDFYKGYKTFDLQEGELVTSISFNTASDFKFNFEKVCKRSYLDIASVNSAMRIQADANGIISNAHVAMGGVAPIPKYLEQTSAYLVGKTVDVVMVNVAMEKLQEEIAPISDVRGTEDYKRLLARQLFMAHFIELFPSKLNLKDCLAYES